MAALLRTNRGSRREDFREANPLGAPPQGKPEPCQPPTMRRMLPRRSWIAAFIGHALRQGHESDPDSLFQTADSLFPALREWPPEVIAASTFR